MITSLVRFAILAIITVVVPSCTVYHYDDRYVAGDLSSSDGYDGRHGVAYGLGSEGGAGGRGGRGYYGGVGGAGGAGGNAY